MNRVPRDSGSVAGAAGTSRRQVIAFAALLAVLLLRGPAAAQGREELSALLPQATLDRARDRAGRLPWAKRVMAQVRREADAWLARPRALPEGKTGLYHDYFCPDHGVALAFSPDRPRAHRCPQDGRMWRGPKLDAYWVHLTLRNRLDAALRCALAWRFTGEERYAQAACGILTEHAEYYRERIAGRSPRRWMAQGLDEAVYVLDAAKAFDLLARGYPGLTAARRRLIVDDYLLPTADYLLSERRRIHNIDCWYNAALAAIAVATGKRELLAQALGTAAGSRWGLRQQLREGVSREGLWKEGSFAYHYYTLAAVVETLASAGGAASDLGAESKVVRSMFHAPLALADARGAIPPSNDSLPRSLFHYRLLYERGAGLFPDAGALTQFLARVYRVQARSSLEALLFGPESLPEESRSTRPLTGRSFPDSGFAVLRSRPLRDGARDDEVYVLLDFGPHGGYHGHLDKLAVALHGLGRVLCPDPGTSGYGLALTSDWYRQTLSHNTILVDRRSQQAASGRLVSFHGKGALQHAVASTEEAYPGVTWTRGVYSSEEGYVVVLDRLRPTGESGDRVRIFDWAWHGFGELRVAFPALEPVENSTRFGDADGYQVARNLRTGTTSGPLQAQWRILPQTPTQPSGARPGTGGSLRLWLGAAPHTRMFTAEVPGNPIQNRLAQLVVRRRGARADFAAVFEPVFEGARPVVTRVRSVSGGVEVFTRQGGRTIALPEEE